MNEITFIVPGKPLGKPRMTQRDKWKRRPSVERYRAWSDLCRECFQAAGGWPVVDGKRLAIIHVQVTARFQPPPSLSKKKQTALLGTMHRNKPDIDNILKGLLDAVFKYETEDDSVVSGVQAHKQWAELSELRVRMTFLN